MQIDRLHLDTVIFGGGIAGLWLLDEVRRSGRAAVLLEAAALGTGQTIASQGILHGGLKYTLRGAMTDAARAIAEMPGHWRACLDGERQPDLSDARLRAEHCYIWRTESIRSRLGMVGAKAGLRVAPVTIDADDRPAALAGCPGSVARLDEQVVDVETLLAAIAQPHWPCIWKIDAVGGLEIARKADGDVKITLRRSGGAAVEVCAKRVILAAGEGNAMLRERLGLDATAMQRRPLHMVMLRGARPESDLPEVNGHCVDGKATRLTITTARDDAGRAVWQVGGQIAERGVAMEPDALIAFAIDDVQQVLPGIDLTDVQAATYRVDRAEKATRNGRPDDATILSEGSVITCWPTKLVLAPHLAQRVVRALPAPLEGADDPGAFDWPRPSIAKPPWETATQWTAVHSAKPG